jgi:hypothetical protein
MRFGSVVFSIRNSIIGMMCQTSEVSSSVPATGLVIVRTSITFPDG